MKKFLLLFVTTLLLLSCEPTTAEAQNLTYGFQSGSMIVYRSGASIATIPVLGTTVDTVQRPTAYTSAYLDFYNNGARKLRLTYADANDSINGRTAFQAMNIINQDLNGQRGNYLGAYTKANLISSDTTNTGYYYYDTDTVSFRFKRASGGFQSLQPKN